MKNRRAGFTVVELLVVIVIVGVLAGLVIPAVLGAKHRARVAATRVDLTQIEVAIAAFKSRFGVEPPSTIVLCENPADWNGYPRAKGFLRTAWPQFDFQQPRDINRNGNFTEVHRLDAAECLVFFLAGTIDDMESHNGFSLNPSNPFLRDTSGNRVHPFMEFDRSRLADRDGDGFQEYCDRFSTGASAHPILYLSAHDGRGYDPAEPCYGMTSAYRISATGKFYKPQSFQLISPGVDGELGTGGAFDPNQKENGLDTRRNEWDNITNFSAGELNTKM